MISDIKERDKEYMEKAKILIIDSETKTINFLKKAFSRKEYTVFTAKNSRDALEVFIKSKSEIVICDIASFQSNDIDMFKELKKIDNNVEVIITAPYDLLDKAIDSLKKGVFNFINKPLNSDELFYVVNKALERRRMKLALERSHQELQNTFKQLKDAQNSLMDSDKLSIVGRLASSITHELRNPLSVINSSVQFCLEKLTLDEPLKKHLEIIQRNVMRANQIIYDLLEFSKPKSFNFQIIPFHEILDEVITMISTKCEHAKVKLEKKYNDNFPEIKADKQKLEQVFMNIILNAIDAMPNGGILTISVKVDAKNHEIVVTFADTGIGIEKENIKKIFEPFFTTKKEKGTGLGLSTAYSIIKEHGGNIKVDSEPGKGAMFIIYLPMRK